MRTAEEGGATVTTNSSYGGGGGAGGKFRKKPFPRPTTPYDRAPTPFRRNDNSGSWLTKLVVDPASKLIYYGAHRLFAPLFRKRLPPPPPPQAPDINRDLSGGLPEAVRQTQYGAKELTGGERSRPINSCSSTGISKLEQLLKQKTFTKFEIDHLTELLQSRAGEVSLGDDGKRNEEKELEFGRHQQFVCSPLEGNGTEGDRSHGVVSTATSLSRVLEDGIASPAELGKAYMGSRPSKVSLSMLGMRGPVSREDTNLLKCMGIASKYTRYGAPDNGFMTPKARGRPATYNVSRVLNSRIHPNSTNKGNEVNDNGYAGLAISSASLSLVEPDERFKPKPVTLKRRNSVLDDGIGSVSSIRRIRQKLNLMAPIIPNTTDRVGTDTNAVLVSSKQKPSLIGEQKYVSNTVGENADQGFSNTSHTRAPPRSSEVAAKILQNLEKWTPKKKSSEYRLVDVWEKSPFKLTQSMLHGQALRSMEDVSSSKLLLDFQDDDKLQNRSNATLPHARDSTSQEQVEVEENGFQESDTIANNDSAVALKASDTSDSVVNTGVSEPPQKKRAFRVTAQEVNRDYLELDDDPECNGLASRPSVEGRGPTEAFLMDSISPDEELKIVKSTVPSEIKLPSGNIMSKTSDFSCGAVMLGEGSSIITLPALEDATAAAPARTQKTNNPLPLVSFSSEVADEFLLLTSGSISRMPETKQESFSSMVDFSAPGWSLNPLKAEDRDADTIPSATSNELLHSSPVAGSLTAAPFKDTNQNSTASPLPFTSSISTESFVHTGNDTNTSITSASTSSIFGSAVALSTLSESVKLGVSEPPTAASAASTMIDPVGGDSETKVETGPSSSTSLSNVVASGASRSGHGMLGLSSLTSHSTGNNHQDSHSSSASGSFLSSVSEPPTAASAASAMIDPVGGDSETKFETGPSSSTSLSNVVASGASRSGHGMLGLSSLTSHSTGNNHQDSHSSSASGSFLSSVGTVSQGISGQSVSPASSPPFNINSSTCCVSSMSSPQSFNPNTSFGFSPPASSSVTAPVIPNSGPTSTADSGYASALVSASPSTGFSFGMSHTSAPTDTATVALNSSPIPTLTPVFPFMTSSASVSSSPSPSLTQFVFGKAPSNLAASTGNNNQMNAEDSSMAEDPVQLTAPSFVPVFGQTSVASSNSGFMFGSTAPSQANNGFQQNQFASQTLSPFQASSSGGFNAGGSFSLGSGGGDKSTRRFVKINRSKNRKK